MSIRVVLTVASGSYKGRKLLLRAGQTLTVGRTESAYFAVPHDTHMSSLHFSLACTRYGCRIKDLDSSNGTLVNGQPITEGDLHDGDEVRAGQTTFTVEIEGAVQQPDGQAAAKATAVAPEAGAPPRPAGSPRPPRPPADRLYAESLKDEDPGVRREALMAAAWTGQKWLLDYCRGLAAQPADEHWGALWLLAVLGQPSDLDAILKIGRAKELGSRRFELLASFGHPGVVGDLLTAIGGKDPNAAVAAGVAFTKITGAEIDSQERVTLPPEDGSEPDEVEQEFLDEAFSPDPKLAHDHWNKVKDRFAQGTRWRRGVDLSRAPLSAVSEIDMEARWEAHLRARYAGQWKGTYAELTRLTVQKSA